MKKHLDQFILAVVFFSVIPVVHAQQKLITAPYPADNRQVQFIHQAPELLPQLVNGRQWDLLQHFTDNWKQSGVPSRELIFSITTLAHIQLNQFSIRQLPCDAFYFMEDYARELANVQSSTAAFKYYINLSPRYRYDATADARRVLLFTQAWAKRLQANCAPYSSEWYLCQVFSGQLQHPRQAFEQDRRQYSGLDSFQTTLDHYNNGYFTNQRNRTISTIGLTAGAWMPAGHLSTLGVHPSFGFLIGIRNQMNEYDLDWTFRVPHVTRNTYTVLRGGALYSSDYYDGGNISFDYTRYLVHHTYFDFGLTCAAGYDYFNFTPGYGSDVNNAGLAPLTLGSFDVSNGIRSKFFFHRWGFIGLTAKYHLVNYCNTGGSDLRGNAFSIELAFGTH